MNAGAFLEIMWHQASVLQLLVALVAGVAVGYVYFMSLRWSINHLNESKHKIAMFASIALLRILLFFGVMITVAHRNVAVIMVYIVCFFVTKMVIVAMEKGKVVRADDAREVKHD